MFWQCIILTSWFYMFPFMSHVSKPFTHKCRRRGPLGVYASESAIGKKNVSISASFLPGSDIVNVGVTVKPSILPFSIKFVVDFCLSCGFAIIFSFSLSLSHWRQIYEYTFFNSCTAFFLHAWVPSCALSRCSQPWSFDGFEVALGTGKPLHLLGLVFLASNTMA